MPLHLFTALRLSLALHLSFCRCTSSIHCTSSPSRLSFFHCTSFLSVPSISFLIIPFHISFTPSRVLSPLFAFSFISHILSPPLYPSRYLPFLHLNLFHSTPLYVSPPFLFTPTCLQLTFHSAVSALAFISPPFTFLYFNSPPFIFSISPSFVYFTSPRLSYSSHIILVFRLSMCISVISPLWYLILPLVPSLHSFG